jgi:transposase-like protein
MQVFTILPSQKRNKMDELDNLKTCGRCGKTGFFQNGFEQSFVCPECRNSFSVFLCAQCSLLVFRDMGNFLKKVLKTQEAEHKC